MALMRATSIHGRIGKINRAANVEHTVGIAKPDKSAGKGKGLEGHTLYIVEECVSLAHY
jgi:hypothetical protein